MAHKELFLTACEASCTRTGTGIGSTSNLPWDDPVFKYEENIVRKIKKIETNSSFIAAGAGYAYTYEFNILRNSVSANMWNVDYFGRVREGSRKQFIYTKRHQDADSYLYASLVGGRELNIGEINYPDGFEPVVLGPMTLQSIIRIHYDGTPSRAWYMYTQVVMHYFTEEVSPKLYAEYSRQYRVRQ